MRTVLSAEARGKPSHASLYRGKKLRNRLRPNQLRTTRGISDTSGTRSAKAFATSIWNGLTTSVRSDRSIPRAAGRRPHPVACEKPAEGCETQFVLPARRPSAGEISCPDANDRRRPRPCRRSGVAPALSHGIALGRGLRPDAEHAAAVRDTPLVVAEERVLAGERLVRPRVVRERLAAIRRPGKRDARPAVRWVAAAIVELHVDRAVDRIDGHPLQELIGAAMDRIVVDPRRWTPRAPAIGRPRDEHVDVAIPKITPRDVHRARLAIDSDLWKPHRPRDARDAGRAAEVRRPDVEDRTGGLERPAAVARHRQRDVESLVPDDVLRPVRRDRADDPDDGAVVVAREPGFRADASRRRPRHAGIRRMAE